jgi:hypothetical protein
MNAPGNQFMIFIKFKLSFYNNSNPCLNGGRCEDMYNKFKCKY